MCGITGAIWNNPSAALEAAVLERMTALVAHRGPDDSGRYTSDCRIDGAEGPVPGVALGHRRLSIIDLAGSREPLTNEDGTVWLVFNGEIYNFRALRERLEAAGHRFQTAGDAETIVHLYEEEGEDFARHLWGMFAVAIWDSRRRQLVLARDRLGKKPLVYCLQPNRLLFASELKSLLAVPGVPREVDPQAIDAYLAYQYVPHPQSIFRAVQKLPPAHYAVWREGRLEVKRYWQPDLNRQIDRPWNDYAAELRELLADAVRLRLQSDVPLGAFLSGGIDSSIIVGLMSRLSGGAKEAAGGNGRIKTFSIGFSNPRYDETAWAREVAERFGTDHHELRLDARAIDVLPKLIWHYDEPFADSSAVPTWYVAELARREVKVVLTGDGGDELFAGYDRYRAVRLAARLDRLPRPIKWLVASSWMQRLARSRGGGSFRRRFERFAAVLAETPMRRYLDWVGIFDDAGRDALWSDDYKSRLGQFDAAEFLEQAWQAAAERDPVTTASLADLTTYLPCDLLVKVDIASMAHGLECRQPFLDHRLVELAAAMPMRFKQRSGRGKRILRHAMADLLSPGVRRRPKMGFGVPIEEWLRGELREMVRDALLGPTAMARGYFRREAVTRLLDEHQSGQRNHAGQIWSLLVLELWHRQWVDAG